MNPHRASRKAAEGLDIGRRLLVDVVVVPADEPGVPYLLGVKGFVQLDQFLEVDIYFHASVNSQLSRFTVPYARNSNEKQLFRKRIIQTPLDPDS
ncbi:hypothetical protein CYMTET_49878 [Cymbomonas tetramitiformis]|uniref:Uncharacterized protein n=1 Tax=Cymbomonas tetramitiformis TaxID=36881 RepID=A0AAE0BR04_9CHLO|nr:hypothetical protein CYMTET_49878 [Cymbomonas tetramitiformis]